MKTAAPRLESSFAAVAAPREWLVTNGLGGYASGPVAGGLSRRYHGLLVAALPAPLGRVILLNRVQETVQVAGERWIELGENLESFSLDDRSPVWRFRLGNDLLEKRLVLVHRQNTVHITYRRLEGVQPLELSLSPAVQFRRHEAEVAEPGLRYRLQLEDGRYEITAPGDLSLPGLKLALAGPSVTFTSSGGKTEETLYAQEAERGYAARGFLWQPGSFASQLRPGQALTLIASIEPWALVEALPPELATRLEKERAEHLVALGRGTGDPVRAQLTLAADQFLIAPVGREEDRARAHALGHQVRTVIAGYHWFTDWGRDTMISLEGLALVTGRHQEAGWILRSFAQHVRDGLIPNLFPEGKNAGLYHTADATLWFLHALDRYVALTGDRVLLRDLLPQVGDILEQHVAGTRFGIAMDPSDALLRQGAPGLPLTWMDAKLGDWVVTPRRSKAVEINALWYNALCLGESWWREAGHIRQADRWHALALRAKTSFQARFWNRATGHLNDVIDGEEGDDWACRPNQILSFSLPHPVLDEQLWAPVLDVVQGELLTPYGLRSLSPRHPDYQPQYFGDLRARDAAYHQGTVWAWWIGPYCDAHRRVHPVQRAERRALLQPLIDHLQSAGIGSVSEIFDAEPPYTPRGCIAQAWSVAELLRSLDHQN